MRSVLQTHTLEPKEPSLCPVLMSVSLTSTSSWLAVQLSGRKGTAGTRPLVPSQPQANSSSPTLEKIPASELLNICLHSNVKLLKQTHLFRGVHSGVNGHGTSTEWSDVPWHHIKHLQPLDYLGGFQPTLQIPCMPLSTSVCLQ